MMQPVLRSCLPLMLIVLAPTLMAPGPIAPTTAALESGALALGSLLPGGETLPDGQFARRFTINASQGQSYSVWLASDDFDSVLYLYAPDGSLVTSDDDGWSGTNSRLTFTTPTTGAYTVFASSYSAAETGAFRLLMSSTGRYSPAAMPLAPGSTTGTLDAADPAGLESGLSTDYYLLTPAPLGQVVTVTLRSAAFDSLVYLVDSDGSLLAVDDNSAGGRDATLSFPWTPAPEQEFYLAVTSVGGGAGGYFLERTGPTTVVTPTPMPVPIPSPVPTTGTGTLIGLGQNLTSTLEATDAGGRRAGPVDRYRFSVNERMLVQVGASSRDFDTYLQLYDARGGLVGEDDDSGRRTDSLVVGELAPGEYVAEVSSYNGAQTGAYAIQLDRAELRTEPESITVGSESDGSWTVLHPTDVSGHRVALYTFRAPRDDRLTLLLNPQDEGVYCRLELEHSRGRHEETSMQIDDGCVIVADVRGGETYAVQAIGARVDDDTRFVFSVTPQVPSLRWSAVELNRDLSGHVNWSSPMTDWNAPGAGFTLELARGQAVDITVRQTGLDARVFVTDGSGRVLESSNDSLRLTEGGGLRFTAPENDWYRIVVTGRQRWFDNFTLRVTTR